MKKSKALVLIMSLLLCLLLAGCDYTKSYDDSSKLSSSADSWSLNNSSQSIKDGVYKGTMRISGYGSIWKYDSDKDGTVSAKYKLNVKTGKAKLILVTPDKNVSVLVENDKKSTDGSLDIPVKKGKNIVKLVGYDKADVEVEFSATDGKLQDISTN